MTFTYDLTNGFSDAERVRFHLGDTDAAAAKFSDEEIAAIITEAGSWQDAVIACIQNLIARLSVPDFKADWLQVTASKAREGYESLLEIKEKDFGLGGIASGVTHVYRADSDATEEPDYSQGALDAWSVILS